jgi:hypothetical protein
LAQELGNNYSEYLNWYEEGFILITENYIEKKDYFMAKATVQSILENSETADIKNKAKKLDEKIKTLEKK